MAHNIRQLREDRRLGYNELSRMLSDLGREIPPLGLRRIEARDRRVDTDDLVALALALGVSPLALLLPTERDKLTVKGPVYAPGEIWDWGSGDMPLSPDDDSLAFLRDSNPLHYAHMEQNVRERGFKSLADAVQKFSAAARTYPPFPKRNTDEQEQDVDGDN